MDYRDVLNSKYFVDCYSKIEEMKKDFPVNHGFVHVNNVINNALRLSKEFKLRECEERLLLVACALHDIGYLEGRDEHAFNGAILAEKYLKDKGFNGEEIKIICDAIRNHGGKRISDFEEPVSMCLAISDKLDFVSSRYVKEMLDEEKSKIFPCILDTCLKNNDKLVLNIYISKDFSVDLFEKSSYYRKLNDFFALVSSVLNKDYEIKYVLK